jgi:S1-C subfamily serine protease
MLFERVVASVVSVQAERPGIAGAGQSPPTAASGLVIEHDGEVVTMANLIAGATSVTVTLQSGQRATAQVAGVDPVLGIALLRINGRHETPAAPLSDSATVRVGEEILAVGRVDGGETMMMTRGIVSRRSRSSQSFFGEPLIQTDAAIVPTMVGGPLVDHCGDVVALIVEGPGGAGRVGFAIPLNAVLEVTRALRSSGRVVRPWIGLHGRAVSADLAAVLRVAASSGYLVESVDNGSPADRAGIRGGHLPVTLQGEDYLLGGDVLTAIGNLPVRDEID